MSNYEAIRHMSAAELACFLERVFTEGRMHERYILIGEGQDCAYVLGSNPYDKYWLEAGCNGK